VAWCTWYFGALQVCAPDTKPERKIEKDGKMQRNILRFWVFVVLYGPTWLLSKISGLLCCCSGRRRKVAKVDIRQTDV
jgi:hypothetical protein